MLEDNETCPLDTELGGTHLPGRETRHCTSENQALATLEHIRRNSPGLSRGSSNNPRTLRSGGARANNSGPPRRNTRAWPSRGSGPTWRTNRRKPGDVGGLPQKLRPLNRAHFRPRRSPDGQHFVPPSYGKARRPPRSRRHGRRWHRRSSDSRPSRPPRHRSGRSRLGNVG
jgi:hypothetical protein